MKPNKRKTRVTDVRDGRGSKHRNVKLMKSAYDQNGDVVDLDKEYIEQPDLVKALDLGNRELDLLNDTTFTCKISELNRGIKEFREKFRKATSIQNNINVLNIPDAKNKVSKAKKMARSKFLKELKEYNEAVKTVENEFFDLLVKAISSVLFLDDEANAAAKSMMEYAHDMRSMEFNLRKIHFQQVCTQQFKEHGYRTELDFIIEELKSAVSKYKKSIRDQLFNQTFLRIYARKFVNVDRSIKIKEPSKKESDVVGESDGYSFNKTKSEKKSIIKNSVYQTHADLYKSKIEKKKRKEQVILNDQGEVVDDYYDLAVQVGTPLDFLILEENIKNQLD
ncbi:MAG: hypothetical protein WC810_27975, partial [Janthinobacterium sp.]